MTAHTNKWAVTFASIGFASLLGVLAFEMRGFAHSVVSWAERDLSARTQLAARSLEEPLRTQDFRLVQDFGDKCRSHGYRFRVLTVAGGTVYDTKGSDIADDASYQAEHPCGEYRVALSLPTSQVLAPFYRALPGLLLAALVGIAGMAFVFFTLYRQRIRLDEMARLERFRRDFIADFSHELKTPLTGIVGAVDMMEGQNTLTGMIKREALRLNRLAQGVLDLARLERADDLLQRSPFDLAALVRETAARHSAICTAPETCIFNGDAQLLGQALSNLIENALRHSGTTSVWVTLTSSAAGVEVKVEDHGCGIPDSEVPRIFERFYRVDAARSAQSGGAGLGLAIVHRIVEVHGGCVRYEPVSPHGSRFVLSFAQ